MFDLSRPAAANSDGGMVTSNFGSLDIQRFSLEAAHRPSNAL